MFLFALLVCLAAGSLADTSAVATPSTTTKLSTSAKLSAFPKSVTTQRATSPISTPRAALSSRPNTPVDRPSPPVKTTGAAAGRRAVPPAAHMIAVVNSLDKNKLPPSKPLVVSIIAAPDPLKQLADDDSEPEDLRDPPVGNMVNQNLPNEHFLREIKDKLQESNDDYYLNKLSGRRKLEISWPKDGKGDSPIKDKNLQSNKNRAEDKNNLKLQGLTTLSKYEMKRDRKPRKHKRRRLGSERQGHSKQRNHRNDLHAVLNKKHRDLYHVQRRRELKTTYLNVFPSSTAALAAEIVMTAADEAPAQPSASRSGRRPHSRPRTRPSTVTRPALYDTSILKRAKKLGLRSDVQEPLQSLYVKQASAKGFDDIIPNADSQGVGTTPSAYDVDSRKQKKLERFVKFINKNRVLLREFIAKKKTEKAEARGAGVGVAHGFFRNGAGLRAVVPQPLPLDLSPGRGVKIDSLRSKGRICQRNVMIPEGPKYDSRGCTYMSAFEHKKGSPDYPATKRRSFLIPACCNCCKKSVLGCE